MRLLKTPQSSSGRFRKGTANYWKDGDELHKVLHSLPGYFRAVLLDLIDNPMAKEEFMEAIENIEMRMSGRQKRKFQKTDIKKDIDFAIKCRVLEIKKGKYVLTPGGLEIAQYMHEVIPYFFNTILSTKTVTLIAIIIHVMLSAVKLIFGFLSRSAGLIADGIDNTVDTISSILVWFGIKYHRDKIVSLFIIIMMAASVVGIVITGINKVLHPLPVQEGFIAFIVSAISGFVMLLLSTYQYITGKKTDNFAILCQSVDSRNHFLTSLLVCAGILTSYVADVFTQNWLYYSDALAAMIIGMLIAKATFELIIEFLKPDDEATHIPHFVEKARKNIEMKVVYQWLSSELKEKKMSYKELLVRFEKQFCERTPKIHTLTGIGYLPKTRDELQYFLDAFSEQKKIFIKNNKYSIKS